MEIDQKLIEQFKGSFINESIICFSGDNDSKIEYNSDLNVWNDYGDYFKIINPNRVSIPKKISIFSNIQEAIFFFDEWINDLNKQRFDEEIIVCSNENTVDDLLQYLYDYILVFNKDSLNIDIYHRNNSYSGIINIMNINNFFTSNKITYQYSNKKLFFSNDTVLQMPIDLQSIDVLLIPFIKFHVQNNLLNYRNYDYLLSW
ncbi:hypothetical protein NZD88_20795 [Chryseobacterium antibioticum]|uniref:Uncharacterized protein n=1 Tax=Chryseobacterium pyrolae TaxID=2987481 RepID=A0ABT2IMX6_9FLAO|nr:hypothetical protein [Chryseobacterium pyrolae]MCT2410001.1 hypothetical protein [Chryseobacterium pyrolae]